jgi:hypothetical protein
MNLSAWSCCCVVQTVMCWSKTEGRGLALVRKGESGCRVGIIRQGERENGMV